MPVRRGRPLRIRIASNAITGLVWCLYLGLGIATAAAYGYLDIDHPGVGPVASAVLAVVCWPAVFLGTGVRV